VDVDPKGPKRPVYVTRRDGDLLAVAGLWATWKDRSGDGPALHSCCVITTAANATMSPIHDRMPVILPDGLEEPWMAPADGPGLRALQPLLDGWDPAGWEVVPPATTAPRQLSLLS